MPNVSLMIFFMHKMLRLDDDVIYHAGKSCVDVNEARK